MTKEFGALLAQVIPVVALALGLELRHLAREALDEASTLRKDRTLAVHFLATLGVMGIALLALAVLENASIAAAAQDAAADGWLFILYLGVIIAFCAPVVDLAHRLVGALLPRSLTTDILLTAALLAVPAALFTATVIILS
ncbi:hypothetical protein AB0K27_09525 [Micromonospora echinospora]|uniref:hypothetical protein n=1 Tax=Micromonospora echinospora TaxID=1877 RepID=UPI003426D54B